MLRGVCFDLWETLIADPPGQGARRADERVRRIGVALRAGEWGAPPEAVADAVQATVDSLVHVHQDNRDVDADERVHLFYRHLDPTLRPLDDLPGDAHAAIVEAIHDSALHTPPSLLPGAAEVLTVLRARGLRLAMVSNTGLSPGASIRRLLDELGIGRFFTAQIYSDEQRSWKPDARMFDEAVFALGISARDTLYVGDTPEADILGAQAYGIAYTAQVGPKDAPEIRPTFRCSTIRDLIPALEQAGHLPA